MRISIRRAAVMGCCAAAALSVSVPVASAETTEPTTPSYGQVTLSPEESQHLCADLLPRLIDRRNKLVARINGGAGTKGSVAWLRARADSQRAKGHTQIADQLVRRADRRAGRVDDLKSIEDRLTTFKNSHCVAK
jgi:predicted secreted protein